MVEKKISYIENELKKRLKYHYQWGQKQNDEWDAYTNFIYKTSDWEYLLKEMKAVIDMYNLDKRKIFNYAANRWYNFWSAMAVEKIFIEITGVEPAINKKDKEVDFFIQGIPFDHKTTVFPQKFTKDLVYAKAHKNELIAWLYKNQSNQQRQHYKNRLFIVVYSSCGEHWKLKSDISFLKIRIEKYISEFTPNQLLSFTFAEGTKTFSDIIWAVK